MSAEQQSPIRFQIEESVWLDHHADAARIVTLDLEPDVQVVEADQLINIRGNLVLTGRFLTGDDPNDSLDLESSSLAEQLQFQPLKVDQKEISQSELRGSIESQFPVDVTVPADKVRHVEDVHVDIEHFDYTVSEGRCLNIRADIALRGVENGLKVDNTPHQQENSEIRKYAQDSTFEVSASKENGAEGDREGATEEQEATDFFRQDQKGTEPDTVNEDKARETTREVSVQNESMPEPLEREAAQSDETPDQESSQSVEKPDQEEMRQESPAKETLTADEEPGESKVVDLFDAPIRTNFNPSSDPYENKQAEEGSNHDEETRAIGENKKDQSETQSSESLTAGFLTQLMSGDEEEDERTQFTKMKMCIIQRSESLQEIAERYAVPVDKIIRMNQLENEEVYAGQILYIPQS